jgi:uncharacterized protein (DUF302 family)
MSDNDISTPNIAASIGASTAAVERVDISTGLNYDVLVRAFERELGHWDPAAGNLLVERQASWSDVERDVERMAGPHGLMIFFRVNQGAVTSLSGKVKRCSLYLVGNPVIANQILSIDLRASFYVPFRVCLYGAVISYDRPSSFLGQLGRPELKEIGALLDQKIDGVVDALRKS